MSLALRGLHDHEVIARAKPKATVDPEHEKRWKLEEEKRQKAETELQRLKEELARKVVEPPALAKPPKPRIATIYRGLHNIQRVRTDRSAVMEEESSDAPLSLEAADNRNPPFPRTSPIVAAGNEREP